MNVEKYFKELRFDPKFHLGLGDIRLTIDQQEKIVKYVKSQEDLLETHEPHGHNVTNEQHAKLRDKIKQLEIALKDAALGHFPLKTFSSRPCSTCDLISDLLGRPFGCKIKALEKK